MPRPAVNRPPDSLDQVIILGQRHLLSVLREFVTYYNPDRPHRTLGLQTPELRPRPTTGPVRSRPVLNGFHHVDERAA
jgi:putative transposase